MDIRCSIDAAAAILARHLPESPERDGEQGLDFAGWAKTLTGAATIRVGSVELSGEFLGAFDDERSPPSASTGWSSRWNATSST